MYAYPEAAKAEKKKENERPVVKNSVAWLELDL